MKIPLLYRPKRRNIEVKSLEDLVEMVDQNKTIYFSRNGKIYLATTLSKK